MTPKNRQIILFSYFGHFNRSCLLACLNRMICRLDSSQNMIWLLFFATSSSSSEHIDRAQASNWLAGVVCDRP